MKYSKFFKSIPLEHFVEYNPPLSKKWSPIDHQNDFFEESDISNQITSKGQEESLQGGIFGCKLKSDYTISIHKFLTLLIFYTVVYKKLKKGLFRQWKLKKKEFYIWPSSTLLKKKSDLINVC